MPALRLLPSVSLALLIAVPAAAQDGEVSIKREPVRIRPADQYQIPLALESAQSVTLRAPVTGVVQTVVAELGNDLDEQQEVLRFDDALAQLELKRARVLEASGGAATKFDVEIAQLKADRLVVRSPIAGRVLRIDVVPGTAVVAGSPLATIASVDRLTVRLPVQRGTVEVGQTLQVRIESTVADGTVTAILPAGERFGPLRPLFGSLVEAVVEIDAGEKLAVGQTVVSDLIPRDAVIEVPNAALQTRDDGGRAVFVIRDDYAVSVPVQTLGRVGEDRTFVAGRFVDRDELVTGSSQPLVDGALVVPQEKPAAAPASSGSSSPSRPAAPTRRPASF